MVKLSNIRFDVLKNIQVWQLVKSSLHTLQCLFETVSL